MVSLFYDARLRLIDCVRLRIQDVNFEYREILVRDGKGQKDRKKSAAQKADIS